MTRQLIVVDTETSSLSSNATILEIAAVNVETGEEFYMVPYVHMEQLGYADPVALRMNRYFERGVRDDMLPDEEHTKRWFTDLRTMLRDNTFGGSNPTFDAEKIARHTGVVWHHRLADLAAFAAGVLGLAPTELPGLAKVCELLGVVNEEEHSALADAQATAECFAQLRWKQQGME